MLKYIQRLLKANLLLITIVIVFAITVLSLVKPEGFSMPKVSYSDKIGHCIAYSVLSFFSLISFRKQKAFLVISLCILFGLLMEFFQSKTNYRTAELADAIANSIGVFIGFGFSKLYSQEK